MSQLWQRFINQRSLLIIAIMMGIAWFLSLRDGRFAGDVNDVVYEQIRLQGDPQCDVITSSCPKHGDGIRLSLALLDKPSGLRPFQVQVGVEASEPLKVKQVKLIFSMSDMQMGDLKQSLTQNTESGKWTGQAILPICTSGRSDWQVQVEMIIEKRIFLAEYAFKLER